MINIIKPSATIIDLDDLSINQRIEYCGRLCYKSEDKITDESADKFVKGCADKGHNSVLEMAKLSFLVDFDPSRKTNPSELKYLVIDKVGPEEYLVTGTVRALREFALYNPEKMLTAAIMGGLTYNCTDFTLFRKSNVFSLLASEVDIDNYHYLKPSGVYDRHKFVYVKFVVNRAVSHELVRHRPIQVLQESQRYCNYSLDKFGNQVAVIDPMFFKDGSTDYSLWKKSVEQSVEFYFELLKNNSPQAARTVLPNSCKTELIIFASIEQWKHMFKLRCGAGAEPSMKEVMIPLREEFKARGYINESKG